MATFVFKDADVNLDSNDISAYTTSVTLDLSADAPEDTAMGDTFTSLVGGGIKSGTATIEFNQDFADNLLDEILWGIFNGGTAVTLTLKPTSAAVGTSNPSYSGSVILTSYSPLSGSVGDKATTSITCPTSGTITRATS